MSTAVPLAVLAGLATGAIAGEAAVSLAGRRRPSGRRSVLARLGVRFRAALGRLGPTFARAAVVERLAPAGDLKARIVAAGEPGGLGVREWTSIKVACAVAGALAAGVVAGALPGRLWIAAVICGPLAGFLLPDFWLGRAASARAREAVRQLPDMLDLLRVALGAGMPPQRALASVASRFDGPLALEWRRMAAAGALGAPLDRSLSDLAERLPAPAIRSFAETMRSANRHGLSLADALATLAAAARHARQQRMREQAARAAPKIQLVVALVLVPSVMLVIAAGMVSQLAGVGVVGFLSGFLIARREAGG